MRMYYAHAKPSYGTSTEMTEKGRIKARFGEYKVIDPGKHEGNIEKQRKGMMYCLQLIDGCDAHIFQMEEQGNSGGWKRNQLRSKQGDASL